MRRRGFIGTLGGAALVPALEAHTQTPEKVWRIGVLASEGAEPFRQRLTGALRNAGYVEGRNVRIEMRAADARQDLLPGLAAELVALPVDLIVARLTPAVLAARHATQTIPIVMAGAGNPVGTGLVASLARPGGNVTGVGGIAADLGGKLVEIIRDMTPSLRRLAVLANARDTFTESFLGQIRPAATQIGVYVRVFMIADEAGLEESFRQMATDRPDAVIVQPSLSRRTAVRLARELRLPSVSPIDGFAAEGGLLAYAWNVAEVYRQTALYVDKILRGAKPADLPVTQPSLFELSINLGTARAIGLTIPPAILARADEVIE